MILIVLSLIVFCSAFFPAYLGYLAEHARVGYLFTIWFALCAYIPFIKQYRNRWAFILLSLIVFGYIIESIGLLTCFPYGCFDYSDQLWVKLLWIVPVMLAFTWPPLVLWVWSYVKNMFWQGWKVWIWWAIGLVLVDLILDPIAVSIGLWSYVWGGFWFGVPLSNFLGRLVSGSIAMMLLDFWLQHPQDKKTYTYGLWLTLSFFVGYIVWKFIIPSWLVL